MIYKKFVWGIFAILAAAIAATPTSAQSDDDFVRLAPASNWFVDYSDDSCALRRMFGEEGQLVFFEMRQFAPSERFTVTVASDDFRRRSRPDRVAITFLPDGEPNLIGGPMPITTALFGQGVMVQTTLFDSVRRPIYQELLGSQNVALAVTDETRDAREASIYGVTATGIFRDSLFLETGSIAPAMDAMRTCMDELLTHWGIDVEAHRSLLREVEPLNRDQWVRAFIDSYPDSMLRNGEQAYVRVRVNVSTEGRVTSCSVQSRFNDETFDELACELMLEHARFEPALDGNGDPIASFWTTAVIYYLN